MSGPNTYKAIRLKVTFVLLGLFLLMLQILPLQRPPSALAAPDTIVALALCWAIRAPFGVGFFSLTFLIFTSDIVLQKPLGLATLCVLLVVQWLRMHADTIRDMAFIFEWLTVGAAYCLIYGTQVIILKLIAPDFADLRVFVVQTIGGFLFYPIAVAASFLLFGIKRSSLGDDATERSA